ncbi:MAG TPA: hypothetical protein HPQ00_14850, partial [Magnetococcales bacterium]|nr:hypothetical protein [Magnetococcales bacterium]
KDMEFSIWLENINPGWIHAGDDWQQPDPEERDWNEIRGGTSRLLREVKPADHLRGKELWLVTRVDALGDNDPLRRKTKLYYKASQVKFNSESNRLVPLDHHEAKIFSHLGDTSYEISLRLYEVDSFQFKRTIAGIYDKTPGIVGILKTATDAVGGVVGASIGTALMGYLKPQVEDPNALLVERILLESFASTELTGKIIVLPKDPLVRDGLANGVPDGTKPEESEYVLYDYFKSSAALKSGSECLKEGTNPLASFGYSNRDTYLKNQECVYKSVEKITEADLKSLKDTAYIQLKVIQVPKPQDKPPVAAVAPPLNLVGDGGGSLSDPKKILDQHRSQNLD